VGTVVVVGAVVAGCCFVFDVRDLRAGRGFVPTRTRAGSEV
jgi:hypothetical protein